MHAPTSFIVHLRADVPLSMQSFPFLYIGKEYSYINNEQIDERVRLLTEFSLLHLLDLTDVSVGSGRSKPVCCWSFAGHVLERLDQYPLFVERFREILGSGRVVLMAEDHYQHVGGGSEYFLEGVATNIDYLKKVFGVSPRALYLQQMPLESALHTAIARYGLHTVLTMLPASALETSFYYQYEGCHLYIASAALSDEVRHYFSAGAPKPLSASRFLHRAWSALEEGAPLLLSWPCSFFGTDVPAGSGVFSFAEQLFSTNAPEALPRESDFGGFSLWWQATAGKQHQQYTGGELQTDAFGRFAQLRNQFPYNAQFTAEALFLGHYSHFDAMSLHGSYAQLHQYLSPYDAFINYMNMLSDLALRLNLPKLTSPLSADRASVSILQR